MKKVVNIYQRTAKPADGIGLEDSVKYLPIRFFAGEGVKISLL